MTYGVAVTNAGPSDAPNVMLTNTLPAGVLLQEFSGELAYTLAGSNMIFNLGTVANGGYANLQFTVEPTNAGVLTFSASVGSPGVMDTNTANNLASTNITVTNYLSGMLVDGHQFRAEYDLQNGLVEQSITVTNPGPLRSGGADRGDGFDQSVVQRRRHEQWQSVRLFRVRSCGGAECEFVAAIFPPSG